MPIKVEILGLGQFDHLSDFFRKAEGHLTDGIKRAAVIFGFEAEAFSKKNFLSGPRPSKLGVVTGRLRSSITPVVREDGNDIEITVGTNVEYAPIHEMGYSANQNVRAHDRVVTKVFGTKVSPVSVHVSGHARFMKMPKRAFLAPAVKKAMPAFEKDIKRALLKASNPGA